MWSPTKRRFKKFRKFGQNTRNLVRVKEFVEAMSPNPFVLHVEDDDGDAYLVVRALAQSPYNLRIGRATDGKEAINLLTDVMNGEFETPSLILLDWKLPVVSGLEVLQHARANPLLKSVPIVVFTSSDVDKDLESAKEAGCDDYYVKPIDYAVFKNTVNEICEKYLVPIKVAPPMAVNAMVL